MGLLPKFDDNLTSDFEIMEEISKTYNLNFKTNRIIGTCDGLDAIKQSVYMILNIERYNYAIYSWNYGIELKDLIGTDIDYCISEIEERIIEALIQDDRILDVTDFEFEIIRKGTIKVTFKVITTKGDFYSEKEVNL